jgi:hypothetical protein
VQPEVMAVSRRSTSTCSVNAHQGSRGRCRGRNSAVSLHNNSLDTTARQ